MNTICKSFLFKFCKNIQRLFYLNIPTNRHRRILHNAFDLPQMSGSVLIPGPAKYETSQTMKIITTTNTMKDLSQLKSIIIIFQ